MRRQAHARWGLFDAKTSARCQACCKTQNVSCGGPPSPATRDIPNNGPPGPNTLFSLPGPLSPLDVAELSALLKGGICCEQQVSRLRHRPVSGPHDRLRRVAAWCHPGERNWPFGSLTARCTSNADRVSLIKIGASSRGASPRFQWPEVASGSPISPMLTSSSSRH